MSYFNIINLIEARRKSLEDENYWSAISVALSLPSICSRIEFADEGDRYKNYKWIDKTGHGKVKKYTSWKDKKCYTDFCGKFIHDGWIKAVLGNSFPEVLYSFRCDFVHDGIVNMIDNDPVGDDDNPDDSDKVSKEIYLLLGGEYLEYTEYRIIDIGVLCQKIFDSIYCWCFRKNPSEFKYTRVFDIKNDDEDRKLYKKLLEGKISDCSSDLNEFYSEIEDKKKERENNN